MAEKFDFALSKGKTVSGAISLAVTLHEQVKEALLQQNEALVSWVNRQPLAAVVTCLGDGHDGVWNLISGITPIDHRREIQGLVSSG